MTIFDYKARNYLLEHPADYQGVEAQNFSYMYWRRLANDQTAQK
jgi:hypothetical protein